MVIFVFIIRSKNSSQSKTETEEISDLRRVLPQVCVACVENLILLGKHENIKCVELFLNGICDLLDSFALQNNDNNEMWTLLHI